jgi:2-methylcitrate dehydratase PrpD
MHSDASEALVDFNMSQRFEDLPPAVVDKMKVALLDTLAATVVGKTGQGVPELSALAAGWGGSPQATLLTNGVKAPITVAALVNGVAGRAWDLDDVHEQNTCHVNVNIIPGALALAEARGPIDGREFIAALAAGSEAICRLSAAPKLSFSLTGMSMSYHCGYFGAALVAARLMALDKEKTLHALGIAYSRLSGNQQGYIDGATTVRLMQGFAAEGGVLAALLAEQGLTGSRAVLEGKFGYFHVYQRGEYERRVLSENLGTHWSALEVSIKPVYPCCKYTHGPIEATADAMRRAAVAVDEVARIDVLVTNSEVYDLVCETKERKWNPTTVVDAQFSLPFMVAHAAVHGTVSLDTVQPKGLHDARVRKLMPRVYATTSNGGQGSSRGTFPMPGIVSLTLADGRRIDSEVTYVKGHPKNPMTYADVAAKARACAQAAGLQDDRIEAAIDFIADIEHARDVGRLAALMTDANPGDRTGAPL